MLRRSTSLSPVDARIVEDVRLTRQNGAGAKSAARDVEGTISLLARWLALPRSRLRPGFADGKAALNLDRRRVSVVCSAVLNENCRALLGFGGFERSG